MGNPISRKANIVVQNLESELLIYDLTINKAYCLNETSAFVFQHCDGTNSIEEISDLMSIRFKTLISEELVQFALAELRKDNLLENGGELPNYFAGLNRREIIKKIGFASMIALPVVASIIAPTAVNAASCVLSNMGLACTTSGECCDNGLCVGSVCSCVCVNPGDCITQTGCPSTVNCNAMGQCSP
jgi:Coenzyme PQQ synthesis protein D (PqqD)